MTPSFCYNKIAPAILLDHREPVALKDAFEDLGCRIKLVQLKTGDIKTGRLTVERKTHNDFAHSIIDGRLFRQATKMAWEAGSKLFILEKSPLDLKISREAIQGALITLQLIYKLPVLRSESIEETARLTLYTVRQLHQNNATNFPRSTRRPRGKHRQQLYLLQSLPNIGPSRAENLLKQFKTIENIASAEPAELSKTPGIAYPTAEKIYDLFHEGDTPRSFP